jgi:uncharacterized membrane protein YkoI
MIKRTGAKSVVAAWLACVTLLGHPVAARPRPLLFQDADAAAEPIVPAQRDQLFPSQRSGGVSREQATEMARSRFQGRVVSARTVQMGDRTVHEIRIIGDDNRVHIVRIDAQTGSFL